MNEIIITRLVDSVQSIGKILSTKVESDVLKINSEDNEVIETIFTNKLISKVQK